MLTALLFLGQVTGEWVEISQRHYAKPLRPTSHPALATSQAERTTRPNRIYINNSLPQYDWNKGTVFTVPSDSSTRTNERNILDDNEKITRIYGFKHQNVNAPNNELVTRDKIFIDGEHRKGTGHRLSNTDNVHRVQASSAQNSRKTIANENKNMPIEVLNLPDIENATEEDIFTTIELDDISEISQNKYFTHHMTANVAKERTGPEINRLATNRNKQRTKQLQNNSIIVKTTLSNGESEEKGIKLYNNDKVKRTQIKSSTETTSNEGDGYPQLTIIEDSKSNSVSVNNKIPNSGEAQQITHRRPIKGQIKRVQVAPKLTTYKNKPETSNKKNYEVIESAKYAPNFISATENSHTEQETKNEGFIHKIPNIAYEKTTTIRTKIDKNGLKSYEPIKTESVPNPEEVMIKEILQESEENLTDNIRIGPATGTKMRVQISSTQSPYEYDKSNVVTLTNLKQSDQDHILYQKDNLKHVNTEEMPDQIRKIASVATISMIETEPASSAEREYSIRVLHESKPEFVTKEDTFNNDQTSEQYFETSNDNGVTTDNNIIHSESKPTLSTENQFTNEGNNFKPAQETQNPKQNQEARPDETKQNNTKANTMENLVKLLKVVTETISKNTRRSFIGKLRYLEDLRDSLMANIEERIECAFPDDAGGGGAGAGRRRRSPRGHVEFPSSESALMTISFLTFAVFLIKLVLQVLQIYKNKTMMVPALVASVGRAVGEYHSGP